MSIDISNQGKYVFYMNFRTKGRREGIFCEAEQNFKFAELISKASDYVISVERFKIPIQSIPMLDAIPAAIQLIPKSAVALKVFDAQEHFSLHDFLAEINAFHAGFIVSLTVDGRLKINFNDWTNYSILFDPIYADVFDMDESVGLTFVGNTSVIGTTPVFDRFDQLFKIQISSELGLAGIQQEILDTDVFKNLLTDFIIPTNYSMSFSGEEGQAVNNQYNVVYNVRQDLEFNASSNRRFIMMRSSAPIQNIKVSCQAIYRDGTTHNIQLRPRSVFELKIAFWKK